MKIDRRITNGLAWAGVVLVVGIPTADLLSAQFVGDVSAPAQVALIEPIAPVPAPLSQRPSPPVAKPATEVAVVAPAKPAAVVVKPAVTPAAQTANAVDAFLESGRVLPSYITDGGKPAAPAQVAVTAPVRTPIVTVPVAAVDPTAVASIAPRKVAPVPMPLSMRPQPVAVALVRDPVVVIPPGLSPAAPLGVVRPPATVTADDLQDWETGPLSEFLRKRQAGNAYVAPAFGDAEYDEDGFFLDEGPNGSRARVIRRENGPLFDFLD